MTYGPTLKVEPINNPGCETLARVRFQVETPKGWVGAYDKEALEYVIDHKKVVPAAKTKIVWRWEQDGAGGLNGNATFFSPLGDEVTIPFESFSMAHHFYAFLTCIEKQAQDLERAKVIDAARVALDKLDV